MTPNHENVLIIARFVGPASTVAVHSYTKVRVEVRTAGQALAELGQRLALLVLTLQQVDLMNRDPPRVCITGPPGTGLNAFQHNKRYSFEKIPKHTEFDPNKLYDK